MRGLTGRFPVPNSWCRGYDGFGTFVAALFRRVLPEPEIGELFYSGDHVIHIGRSRGRVVANEYDYDVRAVHIWRLRDGRVSSFTSHVDTAAFTAALAAT